MDIQYIENLIPRKESATLELKKSTGQLERGMESLCAFLNANGGGDGTILLKNQLVAN